MKRKKLTLEETLEIFKESYSKAEVLIKMGLRPVGGNYKTLDNIIKAHNIDTSHFTGLRWNKGKMYTETAARFPLDDILKENIAYKSDTLKKRLFENGIKSEICEKCGINNNWQNQPLTLELHHINGDHYDNRIENLQILCPNCHSQIKNHRSRGEKKIVNNLSNINKIEEKICPVCNLRFTPDRIKRIYCSRKCYNNSLKKENGEQN